MLMFANILEPDPLYNENPIILFAFVARGDDYVLSSRALLDEGNDLVNPHRAVSLLWTLGALLTDETV